jgi:CBS domain-containing protein
VDVKLGGTAAIVLLARLYALAAGAPEHGTVARLRAAADGGTLPVSAAEELVAAYRLLTELRLRHQLDQATAGVDADNLVPLDPLGPEQRARLRATLRLVRDLQDVTAMRFATATVM